jgi:H-type lectin domain.
MAELVPARHDKSKWSDVTPSDSRRQHARADTDMGARSVHHTLGNSHNQASPGDHIHDGIMGNKIGPLEMITGGNTQPEWSLVDGYTLEDVVNLITKFVAVRVTGGPGYQANSVLVSFTSLSSYTQNITFPKPYQSGVLPNVVTNVNSGAGSTARWESRAINVTDTGFTLFLFKTDASDPTATWANVRVQWISMPST